MFLIEVFLIGLVGFLQKYIFSYIGENLTYDVRNELFKGILYKSISWFDNKDRAPGILSNVLSEDIGALNGMTTEHFAIVMEAFLALIIGVILAMLYTWRMGLITLAIVPLVVVGGVVNARLSWKVKPQKHGGNAEDKDDPYK
jgi:ATP-binding cassette subfamily B (MDR/TAP) protein 1